MNSKQIKEELKASRIATVKCPHCGYQNQYDGNDIPRFILCDLCGRTSYSLDEVKKENEQQAN